jgi:hypothetical protein
MILAKPRNPTPAFPVSPRVNPCPPSSVFCAAAFALLLAATACQAPRPQASQGKAGVAMPTLAHSPDVRTEAKIVEMENQYIADKNDQPTRQHEAEAKAAKKKQAETLAQEVASQQEAKKGAETGQ